MVRKLLAVAVFAVAFSYVESAVVVYLRAYYDIRDLIRDVPTTPDRYAGIELGRELATLVMLGGVGWLAGRRLTDRLGFAVFAFGLWDIAYYFWLGAFIGWPPTPLEWDVLFLLPLPWWGPVLAPVLIAAAMVVTGAMAVWRGVRGLALNLGRRRLLVGTAGILLVLYAFMADAIAALPQGSDAVNAARPSEFNWAVFAVGFVLTVLPGVWSTWPFDLRMPRLNGLLRRGAAVAGSSSVNGYRRD